MLLVIIEDKPKVCRSAKQNVPKHKLMNQFKVGKSTLNGILGSEKKFKRLKEEKGSWAREKLLKYKMWEFLTNSITSFTFGFVSNAKKAG